MAAGRQKSDTSSLMAENAELQLKLAQLQKFVETETNDRTRIDQLNAALENQNAFLQRQVDNFAAQQTQAAMQNRDAGTRNAEFLALQNGNRNLQFQNGQMKQKIQKLRDDLEASEAQLGSLRLQRDDLQDKQTALAARNAALERDLHEAQTTIARLKSASNLNSNLEYHNSPQSQFGLNAVPLAQNVLPDSSGMASPSPVLMTGGHSPSGAGRVASNAGSRADLANINSLANGLANTSLVDGESSSAGDVNSDDTVALLKSKDLEIRKLYQQVEQLESYQFKLEDNIKALNVQRAEDRTKMGFHHATYNKKLQRQEEDIQMLKERNRDLEQQASDLFRAREQEVLPPVVNRASDPDVEILQACIESLNVQVDEQKWQLSELEQQNNLLLVERDELRCRLEKYAQQISASQATPAAVVGSGHSNPSPKTRRGPPPGFARSENTAVEDREDIGTLGKSSSASAGQIRDKQLEQSRDSSAIEPRFEDSESSTASSGQIRREKEQERPRILTPAARHRLEDTEAPNLPNLPNLDGNRGVSGPGGMGTGDLDAEDGSAPYNVNRTLHFDAVDDPSTRGRPDDVNISYVNGDDVNISYNDVGNVDTTGDQKTGKKDGLNLPGQSNGGNAAAGVDEIFGEDVDDMFDNAFEVPATVEHAFEVPATVDNAFEVPAATAGQAHSRAT